MNSSRGLVNSFKALLAAVVLMLLVLGIKVTTQAFAEMSNTAALVDPQSSIAQTDAKMPTSKSDTVRIKTNPSGTVKSVSVESTLVNGSQADYLADISNLADIESKEGTYQRISDGIIWDAKGENVSYTGKANEDVPVKLHVSYYLDGDEVEPGKLLGQAGHVRIRYSFENNIADTKSIGGTVKNMSTPFITVTGLLLDSGNFHDVTVSNGKVIEDGSQSIVIGYAFPGLQDSLGIDASDFELPGYFELEADVDNFELGSALTVVSSEPFAELDSGDLSKLDDFGSLWQLHDAMSQLVDGSNELVDAMDALVQAQIEAAKAAVDISGGAKTLESGAKNLYEGATKTREGADALANAGGSLDEAARNVAGGVGVAAEGSKEIASGANDLERGIAAVVGSNDPKGTSSGLRAASAGAHQLSEAAKSLQSGVDSLASALSTARAGAEQMAKGLSPETLAAITALLGNAVQEISAYNTLAASINALATDIGTSSDTTIASLDEASQSVNAIATSDLEEPAKSQIETQKQAALESIATAKSNAQTVKGKATELAALANSVPTTATQMAVETIDPSSFATISQKAAELASGLAYIESSIGTPDDENTLSGGVSRLASGTQDLAGGIDEAVGALETVDEGANELYSAASSLADSSSGLPMAASGAYQLAGAIGDYADNIGELAEGTKSLEEGARELASGVSSIADATDVLATVLDALATAAPELREGGSELTEGLKMFDEEGISSLVNAFDGNVAKMKDTVAALGDLSRDFDTFSGKPEGVKSSVSIVFETEAIEIDS